MTDNSVDGTANGHQLDLAWSLQPVVYFTRLLGIDPDLCRPRSALRRYAFLGGAVSLLLITLSANVIQLVYPEKPHDYTTENARFWISIIKRPAMTLAGMILQLIVVTKSLFGWKPLWMKVRSLEQFVHFPESVLHRLRKVAFAIVLPVVLIAFLVKFFRNFNSNFSIINHDNH